MRNFHFLLIPALAMLYACNTEDITPVADFTFRNERASTFAMGTYDTCTLVNKSSNALSVLWDLGDGRESTQHNLVLSYEKSGTYDVTLSVFGPEGQETHVTKQVIVKDRVLRSIEISTVQWRENINGWPPSSRADIFLQIQKYTDIEMTEGYLCSDCPVVYTSPVIRDVENGTIVPFTILVDERVIIDKNLVKFAQPQYLNDAYLVSLMAQDKDGKLYCLQNNRGGGAYFGILRENFSDNEFILQNGPFSSYRMFCVFE